MPSRTIPLITAEYYHIYNRGNSKQIIFHDDQDHKYFMHLLLIVNNSKRVKSGITKQSADSEEVVISIGAYCLMPNHFHILIKQEKEGGITLFMQKLLTGYVGYYNKKYKRTGSLFEGRFKSKHANLDTYLKYLFSYVHLNPLKIIDKNWKTTKLHNKHFSFLREYQYSSFQEYFTGNFEIVNKEVFPNYFPTKSSFLEEITSWIKLSV
ncbi:MAG: transposase [Candidatus Nomurabacteria bacterium]|nr:transposase [Candidatus Nomurabacteria bacterium]